MRRVLFQILGRRIYSYPAMLYLGIVTGVLVGTYVAGLEGLSRPAAYWAMVLLTVPALVGSRLLYVITHWDRFRDQPSKIWNRSEGGASLYGGLILALGLSVPLLRILGLSFGGFWDAASITLLVGMIPTKVGCLLNGCCSGRYSTGPLAMNLPDVRGICCPRIPAQLLEAGAAVGLLAVSLWIRPRLPFPGALILFNLAGYGAIRWGLEFIRDPEPSATPARVNQAVSVALIVFSAGVFLVVRWTLGPPAH